MVHETSTYVSNKLTKILKPTITTELHLLCYKYISRAKIFQGIGQIECVLAKYGIYK